MPTHPSTTTGGHHWYKGLDGVRAIAVTVVFLQHYAAMLVLNGGLIGVQIFFVLSGFLITGILFESRHDSFRFRNFYIRRTLRIFPLFYFSWALILIAGLFLHLQWKPYHFLWVVYLGNFTRFLAGNLNFDHIYTAYPRLPIEMGHYWSLAIEEQFYLLWPTVVFFVSSRKILIRICLVACVATPLLRAVLFFTLPQHLLALDFLFRFTFTNCDGFLLGGALALWFRGSERERLLRSSNWLLFPAIALFAILQLYFSGWHLRDISFSSAWVSIYGLSLINIAAAGLILGSLQQGSVVYRLTASAPLRLVGRYSYGFYVYHVLLNPLLHNYLWPLSYPAVTRWDRIHQFLSIGLDYGLVLVVSAASYHFLEEPFLRLKDRFTTRPAYSVR